MKRLRFPLFKIHFALALPFLLLMSGCAKSGTNLFSVRPSDKPIIPGYIIRPDGIYVVRTETPVTPEGAQYSISAVRGSFIDKDGKPASVRIATYTISNETMEKIRNSANSQETITGNFVSELRSESDGSLVSKNITFSATAGYLLLFAFDGANGTLPVPQQVVIPDPSAIVAALSESGVGVFEGLFPHKSRSLWTSSQELAPLSTQGRPYNMVKQAADRLTLEPILETPNDSTDSDVLAAAIIYAKTGNESYRNKVVVVLDRLVNRGVPKDGQVFAVAGNIVGYVTAADLVKYRTPAFENYLKTIAEEWTGLMGDNKLHTIRDAWDRYPQWQGGLQALVALTTIYSYQGDKTKVGALVEDWKGYITGKPKGTPNWTREWNADSKIPYIINPKGATMKCGETIVDVDGLLPGMMHPEKLCDPVPTEPNLLPYRGIELNLAFARLAERQGFAVFNVGDRALLRSFQAISKRYGWPKTEKLKRAIWITRMLDRMYGSTLSCGMEELDVAYLWGPGNGTALGWSWVEGPIHRTCPTPIPTP